MSIRSKHLKNLRNIFAKSVESVKPYNLLSFENNYDLIPESVVGGRTCITLQGKQVDITNKRCHAVGFGKAVLGMAVQLEKCLGPYLKSGILSIPVGSQNQFQGVEKMTLKSDTVFKVYEGAENNQPDDVAQLAAKEIKNLAEALTEEDILFVLISGGGSALLPLPKESIKLEQKMQIIKKLSLGGASIQDMNIVRISLSDIKGGQLAAAASEAKAVISFVISDIVGDPIDLIASGPTWPMATKYNRAEDVMRKYDLWQDLDDNLKRFIQQGDLVQVHNFSNNYIYVVGDNRVATTAAVLEAMASNYNPFIASTSVQGEVTELCKTYCDFLLAIYSFQDGVMEEHELSKRFPFDARIFQHFLKTLTMCQRSNKPLLLIMAGEPTVKVSGSGLGGRNQELALRLSIELYKHPRLHRVYFLAAGTDGIDGPTPAAGALGSSNVIEEFLVECNWDLSIAQRFVDNNDSFNFYKNLRQGRYHIITGHTGTNVMDLQLLLLL